jgi:uncharacterized protein (DUF1697 family)
LPPQVRQPNLERLNELRADTEAWKLTEGVFYLYAPAGIGRSKLAAEVETALDVTATARSWNPVSKLAAMVEIDG